MERDPKKVVRPAEIMERASCGSSAMHDAEADDLLPKLFKILGGRASGVFEHELDEVLEARAAGATDDQVRAIVRRQVARRKARFDELKVA